jgi:Fe-S cluster assembly iron-binding protein IscA
MLTLTDNASNVVHNLTDSISGGDAAGLRISTTEGAETSFSVAMTTEPEPTDEIVERSGARVYLETNAALALADKVLDAEVDRDGSVRFAVGQQS